MKLIIAGGTGLLATEVIRQSLQLPAITSIVVLSRKQIEIDPSIDSSKLKIVLIEDYGEYPDAVRAHLTGADACIWTVAITPLRSRGVDFAEVTRVCQTCALAGLNALYDAGPATPFRFVYLSAEGTPRDAKQKPMFMGEYQVMRGETETLLLSFGAQHHPGIEICIAQPGMITSSVSFWRAAQAALFGLVNRFSRVIPNVHRSEVAATLLGQVVDGFERETLRNADLVRLGRGVVERR